MAAPIKVIRVFAVSVAVDGPRSEGDLFDAFVTPAGRELQALLCVFP